MLQFHMTSTDNAGCFKKSFAIVFQMLGRGERYEKFTFNGVQTTYRSTSWTMDSLYAFKCKVFVTLVTQ
jgi:hypothetical protein